MMSPPTGERWKTWHCGTKKTTCLNISKTKEIIVDFRINKIKHTPITVNGEPVEIVDSFRFLGVNITDKLSWSLNTKCTLKKAQQRLFFLRRLRRFKLSTNVLVSFYRSTIESILTFCIRYGIGPLM